MKDILDRLQSLVENHPEQYCFAPGVSVDQISNIERKLKLNLPLSYKQFLQRFNGGFIAQPSQGEYNYIFSLEEMAVEYQYKRDFSWKLFDGRRGPYPFIPICSIINNEIFITINREETDSPIFDAWHEAFPAEWGLLYPTFKELLDDYIKCKGFIDTIGRDPRTASQFVPDFTQTRFFLAEQHFEKGLDSLCDLKYTSAVKEFCEALKSDSCEERYYFFLSRAYAGTGDYASALLAIEQALKLEPDYLQNYFQQAEVLAKMKDFGRMKKVIDRINKFFEKDEKFYCEMGRIYEITEEYQKAEYNFKSGLKIDQSNMELLLELADLYDQTNRLDEAEELLMQVLDRDKENALAHHILFSVYSKQSNTKGLEKIQPMMEKLLYD